MGKQKPSGHVRWGILGTGKVAEQFCGELKKVPEVELSRVWSRTPANAAALAKRHGIPQATSSLEEFLGVGGLDLVYICTPTALHESHSLACLDAGYGVLCEKPLTTSLESAQRIFSKAREKDLFCMEGMWMRFNPLVQKTQELIRSGAIGELLSVRAELGYKKIYASSIERSQSLLWNFGAYTLSLFHMILGVPKHVFATGDSLNGELDRHLCGVLEWEKSIATFTVSDRVNLANEAVFIGTKGMLKLCSSFICPTRLECSLPIFPSSGITGKVGRLVYRTTGKQIAADAFSALAHSFSGFYREAYEATQCFRSGKNETLLMPWASTLEVIKMGEAVESELMK
jgi:dihydrodiol dehydrogenase / D-xylose 1-dehydrogenase (NADP)